jgi:hypothetical protein
LFDDDEPLANQPYTLQLDTGRTLSGSTNGAGKIEMCIPPDARSGKLTVGTGDEAQVYELRLRHLNPVDTEQGLRSRLENLGYRGELEDVLRQFQTDQKLPESGQADDATRAKLLNLHGS